jgi:hypothetical protein
MNVKHTAVVLHIGFLGFYILHYKIKDRIRLELDFISIYFLTKIILGP